MKLLEEPVINVPNGMSMITGIKDSLKQEHW